jgi:nickel/cobalt transporter (NicO) family protein
MGVYPLMNQAVFTTIAITGFTVAFLHAAIPTHWLPFVLTARVQKWNRSKTLFVTALAGSGHVLFTALLGVLVVWFGIALNNKVGSWFPWIAGGALVLFGLYYVIQQLRDGSRSRV